MLRWTAVDRLLALALTIYEDRIDPSHGQRRDMATDPDLINEWGAFPPVIDGAALAMAQIAEEHKNDRYPEANRFMVGLNAGWQERKAAKVAARLAAAMGNDAPEAAMPTGDFAEIFAERQDTD